MMQFRTWAGAFLALVVAWSACRADEPDTYSSVKDLEKARKQRAQASQNIWWEHLIPGRIEEKRKAQDARANALKEKSSEEKESAKAKPPLDTAAKQTELSKYLRREAICQRLREIADETNDAELAKQADLLESRAWAAYEQKLSSASLARFNPMTEKDAESRLLKSGPAGSGASAQAEPDRVRSIRGENKE